MIHPKFAAQFRTMNGLTAGPFRPLKKWEQSAVAKAADAYGGFLQVAVSSRFG